MKQGLIVFWTAVLVAMLWVTTWASLDRSVLAAAADLWRDPWGRATLFDAYFAFLAVYVWIAWRERGAVARVGWLVALLVLGNIAIAVYFLLTLLRLPAGASWEALFARREARR
ncbi:MAG TPA: DUF1475 family protein [Thermoanaerobaculia bacterium]|nr:DUF1475 family protein [Thermoanaerobaculia bacterium]